MSSSRFDDVRGFYHVLDSLEHRLGGKRLLGLCDGRQSWPLRGVYFFFEPGEERTTSGSGPRVVRVGTHALKDDARSTLWGRLRSHRGTIKGSVPGTGNHRGSVFRLHVGSAYLNRGGWPEEVQHSWGVGSSAAKAVLISEETLERKVSEHIAKMSLLRLEVNDPPGPESWRGYIERNAVALLSSFRARLGTIATTGEPTVIDPPSATWLGYHARSERVRLSGLWNSEHVDDQYDPAFLNVFARFVDMM